jgi:hypothetical protein
MPCALIRGKKGNIGMADELEQFLAKRTTEKQSADQEAQRQRDEELKIQQLFATSGKTEWQRLQEDVKAVTAGKRVDGETFQWQGRSLVLGSVAATFMFDMEVNGILQGCKVVFGRLPFGAYADEPRIAPEVWCLDFYTNDGSHILWTIDERPGMARPPKDLALSISTRLVQYHDEYEASYGR